MTARTGLLQNELFHGPHANAQEWGRNAAASDLRPLFGAGAVTAEPGPTRRRRFGVGSG